MKFINWDWRPAVLTADRDAYAILNPGENWVPVDASDVSHTGALMSEARWRSYFEQDFGSLDLSKIPGRAPHK